MFTSSIESYKYMYHNSYTTLVYVVSKGARIYIRIPLSRIKHLFVINVCHIDINLSNCVGSVTNYI